MILIYKEIIQEVESINFNKPTLSKRYSTIKKARSQSLVNEKKHSANIKNDLEYRPNQPFAKSNDQLASETIQTQPLSNALSVNNKFDKKQSISMAPLDDGDDLQSITSSEFDNNSILITDATRLMKQQQNESTDQAKLHDMLKFEKKNESSSNHSSLLDLANRKVKNFNGPRKLNQRDKSQTSLSAFRGTIDQDYEMNQMDVS